jgi:hypothetical protein
MLSKSSAMFQKLPNGTYGLVSWYPGAKKSKAQTISEAGDADADADADENTESEAADVKAAS